MNELQNKILDIAKFVHKICIENDIKYSLCGGSMIGAVREKGFIPWDDDLDFFLTYDNYIKLIEVIKNIHSDKYVFCLPTDDDYPYCFVKCVDKTTTMVEEVYKDHINMTRGVYIDIFPLIEVESQQKLIKQTKKRRLLQKLYMSKMMKTDLTLKKKLLKPILACFPAEFLKNKITSYVKADRGYSLVYDPDGYNLKSAVPKVWFDEFALIPFEDAEFYIIKDYDKYLTQIFGNYMQRPSEDKQVSNHSFSYLDLNKPYQEYIEEHK